MICIRCQRDSKYPERKENSGCCPGCNKPFAFEPRDGAKMTDKAFQRAIELVSAEGQVKWGVEHLYYELSRRNRSTDFRGCAFFVVPVVLIGIGFVAPLALLFLGPMMLFLAWLAWHNAKVSLLPRGDFERMWDRWGQVHGKPKGVIIRRPEGSRPAREVESDVADYSFDRAVICDRARTVDLLLANNFHFENNCAVLSVDGYPKQAFETVRRMLRRNPRLEVFVLHDVTPEGCRLAHKLANSSDWFRGTGVRIVDVGLRPTHVGPFQGLYQSVARQVEPGGGLSAEEARWLSSNTLELAAIRPEQVIKRLFRAMSKSQVAAATGRDVPTGLPSGAATAGGAAALAGAAMLMPPPGLDEEAQLAELARKKKAADTSGSSSSTDGGGGVDYEVDTDSFSSDADSSDGGADSFG